MGDELSPSSTINSTHLNSTENYGRRCLTPLSPHPYNLTIANEHHFMTSSDRFPVPVRSDVKSNFTAWCCQNLSKRALNALTVQASTTELGRLFPILTTVCKTVRPMLSDRCLSVCLSVCPVLSVCL